MASIKSSFLILLILVNFIGLQPSEASDTNQKPEWSPAYNPPAGDQTTDPNYNQFSSELNTSFVLPQLVSQSSDSSLTPIRRYNWQQYSYLDKLNRLIGGSKLNLNRAAPTLQHSNTEMFSSVANPTSQIWSNPLIVANELAWSTNANSNTNTNSNLPQSQPKLQAQPQLEHERSNDQSNMVQSRAQMPRVWSKLSPIKLRRSQESFYNTRGVYPIDRSDVRSADSAIDVTAASPYLLKRIRSPISAALYDPRPNDETRLIPRILIDETHTQPDVDSMIASGSHHHHPMPTYYATYPAYFGHKVAFAARKSEKSIATPIAIGVGSALLSFLILSNVFLALPLIAIAFTQIFNSNNLIIPPYNQPNIPYNPSNNNNGNNGQNLSLGRRKRQIYAFDFEPTLYRALNSNY